MPNVSAHIGCALKVKDRLPNLLKNDSAWFDIMDIKESKNIIKIFLTNDVEKIEFSLEKK